MGTPSSFRSLACASSSVRGVEAAQVDAVAEIANLLRRSEPRRHGSVVVLLALHEDAVGDLGDRFLDSMVERVLLPRHVLMKVETMRRVDDPRDACELRGNPPEHRGDWCVGVHQVVFPPAHQATELEHALRVGAGRDLSVDRYLVNDVAAGSERLDARVR